MKTIKVVLIAVFLCVPFVVEGQGRQAVQREPTGRSGVVPPLHVGLLADEDRHVHHRDRVAPRIPVRSAEGAVLAEGEAAEAGFLGDLAVDGVVDVLAVVDEPSGQGLAAAERVPAAFHQQDLVGLLAGGAGPAGTTSPTHTTRRISPPGAAPT